MIIPYGTDAPIYHFPRATVGVIVVNVAIHTLWYALPPDSLEPLAMKLGAGLHPLQWLTHNFLHADLMHLVGNMIFLWSYAIIVEGKVGWFPFLLTYLAIGTVHGAVIQAVYLHAAEPSYVLGASGIIFGLMAICMMWAPVNELTCFYLFTVGFRIFTGTFEMKIYGFALLQLVFESAAVFFQYAVHGDPMSSGLLHISGAFWGLIAGTVVLKMGWVDCEGWDVFSLLSKDRSLRKAWKEREARLDRSRENEKRAVARVEKEPDVQSSAERATRWLGVVHQAVEAGDPTATDTAFRKWMTATANRPPREALLGLIKAMHRRQAWAESVAPLRVLCRLYPENADKIRLKLASILLRTLERPTEARRHLAQVDDAHLDSTLRALRADLIRQADRLIEEGVLEVEEEA